MARKKQPANIQRTTIRVTVYRHLKTGQIKSKAYAQRYRYLVRTTRQLRSKATGWNISKRRVSAFYSIQKRRELLHSRIFKGRGHRTRSPKTGRLGQLSARTEAQRKGALKLLEQLTILSARQIKQLIGQSPSLAGYLDWALDHADLLDLTDTEQGEMEGALAS